MLADANRLRRRREYRKLDAAGLQYLRDRVVQLTAQLEQLELARRSSQPPATMLAWREVAGALGADLRAVCTANASLRRHVQRNDAFQKAMHTWVTRTSHVHGHPSPRLTWQDASLPTDPATRLEAMEWITHRLFHNIDGLMAASGLPFTRDNYQCTTVSQLDDTYRIQGCSVRYVHADVSATAACLEQFAKDFPPYLEARCLTETDNVLYTRYLSPYGLTVHLPFIQNVLQRHYFDGRRYVSFRHCITDDEALPADDLVCGWTEWTVAESVGENVTVVKEGFFATGLRTPSGEYIRMEAVSPAAAACVDPANRLRCMQHEAQMRFAQSFEADTAYFNALLKVHARSLMDR
ncbi:hypothetical protein SPRG_10644 [Saprolegnia parasitica CBS 223.65]|uniref:START domain-containing protein n=2 Tax=Saprolegnia parasitica (strain CBS 223.65) TaxID=695850 RepID=A0A067C083_SAPPC|nr:hypothetical protein SPRG_10644 [Saprolegnia parasitica CBS 223.65]KDO23948.1 hypothetical protein SPRG_10644 [Saprolegnia parasitica CBS 223.65]|eukprot:XP_012205270.1 hypothetical protein SPRG_10644 [Saprolegnia parasitica CBS 223.65]